MSKKEQLLGRAPGSSGLSIKDEHGVEIMAARNGFYPKAYQSLSRIVTWSIALNIIAVIGMAAVIIARPTPQSYAISADGKIIPLVALKEGVGPEAVIDFTGRAIISAFSINFQEWRTQTGATAVYFTDEGHNSYLTAIEPIKNRIVEGKYVSTVAFSELPVIAKSAEITGVMKYKVISKVLIGFEGQSKRISPQIWTVTAIVERVSVSNSPNMIKISSLVATSDR